MEKDRRNSEIGHWVGNRYRNDPKYELFEQSWRTVEEYRAEMDARKEYAERIGKKEEDLNAREWEAIKKLRAFQSLYKDILRSNDRYHDLVYSIAQPGGKRPKWFMDEYAAQKSDMTRESVISRAMSIVCKECNRLYLNPGALESLADKVAKELDRGFYRYFSSMEVYKNMKDSDGEHSHYARAIYGATGMEEFCEEYDSYLCNIAFRTRWVRCISAYHVTMKIIMQKSYVLSHRLIVKKTDLVERAWRYIYDMRDRIMPLLNEKYDLTYAVKLMNEENPHYKGVLSAYTGYAEMQKIIQAGLVNTIPDNYIDIFPLARKLQRKFILHIGGTNSGKTYTAMQALMSHETGIYLGPLRLLAAEQYANLNASGYPCSLVTGEEKKIIPDARYQASTVEVLNFTKHYDVAVIDEAQLISDRERGGAWTNAIIGVLADEIHVCASPEAESIIKRIVASCGDECETVMHERYSPLVMDKDRFMFKKECIRRGDAFIVFSKKSVHAVASDLRSMDIDASIIYGALPYDVRQNEAEKFRNGTTDVVVATDAIGLGLNLPIKRIVFLETEKFDGEIMRKLNAGEIKQIAGRAGRYGIYDSGYVNAYSNKSLVEDGLNAVIPTIKVAYIRFPESLLGIDAPISRILVQWERMKTIKGFKKSDTSHERRLCRIAEGITDDKILIYDFITIPFDEKSGELMYLWEQLLRARVAGEHIPAHEVLDIYNIDDLTSLGLQKLEDSYKVCDMLYYYNERFEQSIETPYIMEEKERISGAIIKILDSHQIPVRKCTKCGCILPWHFRYKMCDRCHDEEYNGYYFGI